MSKIITLCAFYVLIQNVCFATIFMPLSFDKQVEEATSAVEVKLESSKVFKNSSGLTMTEYSFNVLESYNLSEDDLENQKIKLTMPGGTYNGVTSVIDGAPEFNKNEKTFLLLKKIDSKIYLSNFTLGKFKIQEMDGKVFYISDVFPTDPKIGKISKEAMIELMKSKWKISLMIPITNSERALALNASPETNNEIKPLLKSGKSFEREPAQVEAEQKRDIPFFFWIAIASFTFFFTFIFFKLGNSELQHKS
ncbi:MAG: hypothetical protein Q7U04_00220 [Bacteriovorax sp.]|nr:hypothetical protein [Bacteriovorax sp.]